MNLNNFCHSKVQILKAIKTTIYFMSFNTVIPVRPPYSTTLPELTTNTGEATQIKGKTVSWLNRSVSIISYYKWPILIAAVCALLALAHSAILSAIVFPGILATGFILTKVLSSRCIKPSESTDVQLNATKMNATQTHAAHCSSYTPALPLQNNNTMTSGSSLQVNNYRSPSSQNLFNLAMTKEITDQYATTCYSGIKVNNPDSIDWSKPVPRLHHGAQHQARTAMWALVLLQQLRNYGLQGALAFQDKDIPLIILACLFHDSGRQGEGNDNPLWEAESGLRCQTFMTNKGFPIDQANLCRDAIMSKDVTGSRPTSLIQQLLHLADGLEVIRVREKGQFNPSLLQVNNPELDRYIVSQHFAGLAQKVEYVINSQSDLYRKEQGNFNPELKKHYEYCINPLEEQLESLRQLCPDLYQEIQALLPATSRN